MTKAEERVKYKGVWFECPICSMTIRTEQDKMIIEPEKYYKSWIRDWLYYAHTDCVKQQEKENNA